MKNGLLRFYLIFMLVSLVLFSCEKRKFSEGSSRETQNSIERKPENRHPVEPNGLPSDAPKGKKPSRKYTSKISNWC